MAPSVRQLDQDALTIELFGRDTDSSLLHWTPDLFAAQDSNITDSNVSGVGTRAGLWRFSVQASDGVAQFVLTAFNHTALMDQTLRIPLQLGTSANATPPNAIVAVDTDDNPVLLAISGVLPSTSWPGTVSWANGLTDLGLALRGLVETTGLVARVCSGLQVAA